MFDQKRVAALAGAAALAATAACGTGNADADETATLPEDPAAEQLGVEVLDTLAHDPDAFTQGLELRDGLLYESTGLYGSSDVRIVDPGTGDVIDAEALPDDQFGEGLTLTDDALWQITWKEGVAYQRDPDTLAVTGTAAYDGEGWGICSMDATTAPDLDEGAEHLVMSDGSATLTFRDPATFAPTGTVEVTLDGEPLHQINELECVDGQVWANVWLTDQIVRIDPSTGAVGAVVDAAGLLDAEEAAGADVLNGIAAAAEEGTFYLTGKHWPTMFLVRFTAA